MSLLMCEEHPGGDAILNDAGVDSTQGFFWVCNFLLLLMPRSILSLVQHFSAFHEIVSLEIRN